jgi:hypothetical protein
MAAIKNFRRDCDEGLTSAAGFVHRIADQKTLTTEDPEHREESSFNFYSLIACASVIEKL